MEETQLIMHGSVVGFAEEQMLRYTLHANGIPLGSELPKTGKLFFQPFQQNFPKDSRECITIPY